MNDAELDELADLSHRAAAGELMQPHEWERLRELRALRIQISVSQIGDAFQHLAQTATTAFADITSYAYPSTPDPLAITSTTTEQEPTP